MPTSFSVDQTYYAWLRLRAGDTYVGVSPDPWIEDSWVITLSPSGDTSTTLNVTNWKGDQVINDIILVFVTNDPAALDSLVISNSIFTTTLAGSNFTGTGLLTMIGGGENLGEMPPHGIYNDAAARWVEIPTGIDLAAKSEPGSTASFTLNITLSAASADFKIHIDAYGWIPEVAGGIGAVITDADAAGIPFSGDVTFRVPEFDAPIVVMASAAVFLLILIRKTSFQDKFKARR